MAADNSKRSTVESLEEEFIGALVRETGFQPSLARVIVRPIIQHLVDTYPGERLYVPAPRREYPVEEIRHALELTSFNYDAVCERFGISRSTLFRVLKTPVQESPNWRLGKSGAPRQHLPARPYAGHHRCRRASPRWALLPGNP